MDLIGPVQTTQMCSRLLIMDYWSPHNVNSEIFARVSYAKFRENKILAKWQNHTVVY